MQKAMNFASAFVCIYVFKLKPNSITLANSELAPNMFGASSELASVMEFGFYYVFVPFVTLRTLKVNDQRFIDLYTVLFL